MFDKLKKNTDQVQETGDKVFGERPETDVYDCTIDMAYYDVTDSGSSFIFLSAITSSGFTLSQKHYVLTSNEKGNNPFYIKQDGSQHYLQGYEIMHDLYTLVLGRGLEHIDEDVEEKMVNIYDFDSKENVPTEKMVITDLIGKKTKLALQTVRDNKKDSANGYEPIPGTSYDSTEAVKVFDVDTDKSRMEKEAGADAAYMEAWVTRNKGSIRDNRKYKDDAPAETANSSAPTANTATDTGAPAPSKKKLFN